MTTLDRASTTTDAETIATTASVNPHTDRTIDVSRLLSVGRPGAWFVTGLFIVVEATFMFATLDAVTSPWPSLIALVIVSATAVLLNLPSPDPLPGSWAAVTVFAVIASTILISWQLKNPDMLGKETWHFGANTWLLFFAAMRGRIAVSWLGFLSMAAIHAAWAASVGLSVISAILGLLTHGGILLVSALFTIALRNTSRRINSLNTRSVELAAAEASTDAEHQIRKVRVAELAELATPLLQRIASTSVTHAHDRIDYLLAEATLRDSVRARSLHLPEIAKATSDARTRGVEVTLLDDRNASLPSEDAMRRLVAEVTDVLRSANEGRVTVRLAPAGRTVAVSIVVESQGNMRRIGLDEDGEIVDLDAAD